MKRSLFSFLLIVAVATTFIETVRALTDSAVEGLTHQSSADLNISITEVTVKECSFYTTCWDCFTKAEITCGWCSFEHKCTLQSNCQAAAENPFHWINYGNEKSCPLITTVEPNQIPRTTPRTLNLDIDNLPNIFDEYLCAFTVFENILLTNATRTLYGVNCATPQINLLPTLPMGQHNFYAKLSVITTSGYNLAATKFTFFDCNSYSSCTPCASSSFPCEWCTEGHRCTHNIAENCRNDIIVSGVNKDGPSYRKGPEFCPRISSAALGHSPKILVAYGLKQAIKVKAKIVGQFIVQTRFVCQFNIEGRITSVNANLLGDTIYCNQMDFIYSSKLPNTTANFAVIWGGSKPLDNPDNVHVVIYRCDYMANNCSMCLNLEEKYNCGWCHSSDSCEVKEHCENDSAVWLHRNQTCSSPEITAFSPEFGPWEGGTNITIRGTNLGKTFQDISTGISIAGINCRPYEHLYIKATQIVCKVAERDTNKTHHGPVVVQVDNYRSESKSHFNFVDPVITGMWPKYGPQKGGTTLKITGVYLNAGKNIQAFINNLPCTTLSIQQSQVLCLTSASTLPISGVLRMKFDGHDRYFDGEKYIYGKNLSKNVQNETDSNSERVVDSQEKDEKTEEKSIENLQKELLLIQIKTAKAQEAAAKATELAANAIEKAATTVEQLVSLHIKRT